MIPLQDSSRRWDKRFCFLVSKWVGRVYFAFCWNLAVRNLEFGG